ncbi:HAD-IA family hydrolase [Comamonas jiangduensis]|uniref:phosphoglycolate phosphatase n=1 Tax=Comamonas jiangduensis TaxID=1194168 RepID=A0ABV4ICX4_9BURK
MVDLCLFDLDNTLVKTDDLKNIREACKNNANPIRLLALKQLVRRNPFRRIYASGFLRDIQENFPGIKLGVFTRAPRSYTDTVLTCAYPGFDWDVVVANEDIPRTKPHGDGVHLAMEKLGIQRTERVLLIGDSDVDVKAAYNAGCLVAVDKQSWPQKPLSEHWRALELMPDAVIARQHEVLELLGDHRPFLPNLERLLEGGSDRKGYRYLKAGYFVPREVEENCERYTINLAGRSFSKHAAVELRREDSVLSASIEDNKQSTEFPLEWIEAVRNYIDRALTSFCDTVVTVIPHRPGREPRLEMLLKQLAISLETDPLGPQVSCVPDLLAYAAGVRSNHNEHLTRVQRFENVRDHLFVKHPDLIDQNKAILVIDDVVTTGASLIYAHKRLTDSGASHVYLLGLGKNIGDIYAYP